ncbi:branched-chain amino acid ABC transporter permease [Mesorhizobium sp. M7A.F.Ca.US.006.01.1.1]|uniref:branched-chain amino acid ABC transporter permease n=1 Tax=Mesorhizobium sp. M7A.F.Ca.US.006.01.1.1 TaxID=2496707 RepID=UPI000FCC97D0|nr:branched-chain amino acid ABC transporter permease [Mesorhizobium sp. M7A.F.Ca.US.006.01.1.1]RUZ71012.1 branched-chain amino acid ABC transporter permease [Mesorhizobium sp. M7A.F.Ca.US.006.01.1.1]
MLARIVAVALFCVLPLLIGDAYVLHIMVMAGIFTVVAMSLNLVLGYLGQASLGHIGFFGVGAYVSALCSLGFEIRFSSSFVLAVDPKPVLLSFLFAVLITAFLGWCIGKLSFRVRGAYFVIVTISFAEVARIVALNWISLTQGPMALTNIPPLSIGAFGWEYTFYSKASNYYLVLFVGVVTYVLIRRLVQSRIGRAMMSLRDNETLALSVGVDVTRYLVLGACLSAAMAGAAGSLYAHYMRIIDPDVFLFVYTVTLLIMIVTGGKGTLLGPVVGGILFGVIPPLLREVAGPELQWIFYGILMIVIVMFLPQGVVPALSRVRVPWHGRSWLRRTSARSEGSS